MSKHKGNSRHRRLVSGVLAAALALTSVISTASLASLNGKLSASIVATMHESGGQTWTQPTCPSGQVWDEPSHMCKSSGTTGGTTTTTASTISCNSAGGAQKTPAECDALDQQKNSCVSPSIWDTATVSCKAGTATTTTTNTGTAQCASGQWMCGNGQCSVNSVCPTTGTTTTTNTTGGTAGSYVTQPTCQGAAYFWGVKTNKCYSTKAEIDAAEGGSTTTTTQTQGTGTIWCQSLNKMVTTQAECTGGTTTTNTGAVQTVDQCKNSGGTWDAATSKCTAGAGAPQQCTTMGGTWDAAGNKCNPGAYTGEKYDPSKMGTGTMPAYDPSKMGTAGGNCDTNFDGKVDAFETKQCAGGATGTMPAYDPSKMGTGTMPAKAMTTGSFDTFFKDQDFSQFEKGGDFECPEWDTWCQKRKDSGEGFMFGGEGEEEFGWEQNTECLDANSARREKKNVERDVKEIQKQFKTIDLSQAGSSPVLAEAKAQLDALAALDLSDPCEISKAMEAKNEFFNEGGLMQQIGSFKMLADFKREVERVQKEINKEQKYIKDAEAVALLTKAAAKAQELYDNPPLDLEEPWRLFESMNPECMMGGMQMDGGMPMGGDFGGGTKGGFGGQGGFSGGTEGGFGGGFGGGSQGGFSGGFSGASGFGGTSVLGAQGGMKGGFDGGMPEFGCSLEDLQEGDTPRGLLMAARMIDHEGRAKHFEEGGMCTDAAEGIKMFQEEILPTLPADIAAKVEPLMAQGLELTAKCADAEDKFIFQQKLEKLGKKVEKIMSEAGIGMPEFGDEDEGFDLDFGGQEELLGGDLEARLNALLEEKFAELEAKFEQKLQDALAKVEAFLNEKIASIATIFGRDVADSLTAANELLSEEKPELAEALNATVSLDLNVVGEEGLAVSAERVEIKSEVIQYLAVVEQLSPETEDVVADLQKIIAAEQIPVADLATVQDAISDAVTLAQNGEDPSEDLEELRDNLETALEDEDAQIRALCEEGTWCVADVAPDIDVWYVQNIAEANALGVAQGTPVTVGGVEMTQFNPDKPLNMAEGVTMIVKASGLPTNVTVSPEIDALTQTDADWADVYLQTAANEVGLAEIEALFAEAGGASEPMLRADVTRITSAMLEAQVGYVDVSELVDLGDVWADSADVQSMGTDAVHDSELLYAAGILTGANGGTEGNPYDETNRAEASKYLSEYHQVLAEYENTGLIEFHVDGEVVGTFSAEGGVKLE